MGRASPVRRAGSVRRDGLNRAFTWITFPARLAEPASVVNLQTRLWLQTFAPKCHTEKKTDLSSVKRHGERKQ